MKTASNTLLDRVITVNTKKILQKLLAKQEVYYGDRWVNESGRIPIGKLVKIE